MFWNEETKIKWLAYADQYKNDQACVEFTEEIRRCYPPSPDIPFIGDLNKYMLAYALNVHVNDFKNPWKCKHGLNELDLLYVLPDELKNAYNHYLWYKYSLVRHGTTLSNLEPIKSTHLLAIMKAFDEMNKDICNH